MSKMIPLSVGMSLNIHSSSISNMTLNRKGMVAEYTRSVAASIRSTAQVITQQKTGKADRWVGGRASRFKPMWASYHVSWRRASPSDVVWKVSNRKSYARYVFLGTANTITSNKGKVMPVGKSQLGLYGVARLRKGKAKKHNINFKNSVSGQKARNFLMEATRKVYVARGL